NKHQNKQYLILLLSLTNERILKEFFKNKEWAQQIEKRSGALRSYDFIKDIFMNNLSFTSILYSEYSARNCVMSIHEVLYVVDKEECIKMHREHYFYRRLLLHPRLCIFKDEYMLGYIRGLNAIGWLNSKEQCDQLARDLIFNIYYHKGVLKFLRIPKESLKEQPGALRLKECIERQNEIYKKNEDIEKEVKLFRTY
ncbi:hypothetical protein PAEPH01_1903, partial [Pancytospora epiphaga]